MTMSQHLAEMEERIEQAFQRAKDLENEVRAILESKSTMAKGNRISFKSAGQVRKP